MNQLNIEKIHCAHVPVLVVHPIRDTGNPVILYHGWSALNTRSPRQAFLP